MIKFSIVITTKNRLKDLEFTLETLTELLKRDDVELLICNDASIDGTREFLNKNFYKKGTLFHNTKSKGLIANRNKLNNLAKGEYIISLDDDANFLSDNVLEEIENCFKDNPTCGVQNLSIYWGIELPNNKLNKATIQKSKSFVGCGHVWRKTAWSSIPNYPAWFIFYGEEDFASYELFKKKWKIIYNPAILIHHRVDVKSRKINKDYRLRLRRSLRSGWYLYFLFYPLKEIPRRFLYTLFIQIKHKVFKGDFKAMIAIIQALLDVLINLPKLLSQANRLSRKEFKAYQKLPETIIYYKSSD